MISTKDRDSRSSLKLLILSHRETPLSFRFRDHACLIFISQSQKKKKKEENTFNTIERL